MVLLKLRPESVAVEFEPLNVGASITALTVALFTVLVERGTKCVGIEIRAGRSASELDVGEYAVLVENACLFVANGGPCPALGVNGLMDSPRILNMYPMMKESELGIRINVVLVLGIEVSFIVACEWKFPEPCCFYIAEVFVSSSCD